MITGMSGPSSRTQRSSARPSRPGMRRSNTAAPKARSVSLRWAASPFSAPSASIPSSSR